MNKTIFAVAGLLVFGSAVAQPPGGGGGGLPDNATIMGNNDANDDGEITKAEADAAGLALGQNWDMFDLNNDGKVVAEELDQVRGRFGGGGGFGGGGPAGAPGGAPPTGDDEDDEDSE
jgi:hypothetical protein